MELEEMNVLENILFVQSDEEIREIYNELSDLGHKVEANKLRASYIENKVFQVDDIEVTQLFIDFVLEEQQELLNSNLENHDICEFKREAFPYSRMCAFLITYLQKKGHIEKQYSYIISDTYRKERFFLSENEFKKGSISFLLHLLLDNTREIFFYEGTLPRGLEDRYECLEGLMRKVNYKQDLEPIDNIIEELYLEAIANPDSATFFHLRTKCLVLMGLHWKRGNTLEVRSYFLKSLRMTKQNDSLYGALRVLERFIIDLGD